MSALTAEQALAQVQRDLEHGVDRIEGFVAGGMVFPALMLLNWTVRKTLQIVQAVQNRARPTSD